MGDGEVLDPMRSWRGTLADRRRDWAVILGAAAVLLALGAWCGGCASTWAAAKRETPVMAGATGGAGAGVLLVPVFPLAPLVLAPVGALVGSLVARTYEQSEGDVIPVKAHEAELERLRLALRDRDVRIRAVEQAAVRPWYLTWRVLWSLPALAALNGLLGPRSPEIRAAVRAALKAGKPLVALWTLLWRGSGLGHSR